MIVSDPTDAIEQGAGRLNAIGVITDLELKEYISNYQWKDMGLCQVVELHDGKEQIDALLRNLDD